MDLDDETAAIRPDLASGWTASPDSTVYTFTLRSNLAWSDGHPLTAADVRYGILRSLAPATQAPYAYVLTVIKNAAAYNSGTISDPDQVGVTALDDTHLRVVFEQPAANVLSVLALWAARPMPRWAIEAWGAAWTEPAHIVTSDAYRLTARVASADGDYLQLDKNPAYYDAANVQIERARLWTMDDPAGPTAWTMYLNGQLDTADLPIGTSLDPVLRQEVRFQPIPCTYYYGFSVSQPPFDNPLVRKAFIAATNRQGLINTVTGGVQQPALTFTPPGVFGHVDGYAEGVGIPYNPTQARQWLAQAGYPNGQGLPPITLWFNTSTGHRAIANYIRNNWASVLGVTVNLQDMAWSDYLREVKTGRFQVWRLGWCADYLDAYNFLHDAFEVDVNAFGGWNNPTYWGALEQAARTADPVARRALYKQAEEILVETDAVMLPLYYYGSAVATRPYLERTYPTGTFDIATWRIVRASAAVSPAVSGTLTSYHGDTTVQAPAGAFTDTVTLTQAPAYGMPPGGNLASAGHVFELAAVYSAGGQPAQLAPGQAYTVTVRYTDAERWAAIEDTLALYWWDGSRWQREPSSAVDVSARTVTAAPDHFSLWAVLGETHRTYLPAALR